MAAAPTKFEYKTINVDTNPDSIMNREALDRWEVFHTTPGCLDVEGYRSIGLTIYFRRPVTTSPKHKASNVRTGGK
jgi:hypothetical protein